MNYEPCIHIGNQTAFSARTVLEPFEYALDNAFGAFEWFPDKKPWGAGWDSADLQSSVRTYIRDAAAAVAMRLSVHAHWTANPLQPEASPVLLRDLELTSALGARLLNLHLYTESGLLSYARSILPWLEQAGELGIQISIENTPETTPQHFNELFATLRELNASASMVAGMCFDLGHANLCPVTHNDYLGYLDQLDPQVPIIHLHVHENRGDADSHLPLFTGPAATDLNGIEGFIQRLKQRHFGGSLILEQWPYPASLLTAARDRLVEMFRATDQPVYECPVLFEHPSATSPQETGASGFAGIRERKVPAGSNPSFPGGRPTLSLPGEA